MHPIDLTQDPFRSWLGPLAAALDDPEVTCLLADGRSRLWVERRWALEPVSGSIETGALEALAGQLAQHLGVAADQTLLQTTAAHGLRVQLMQPPLVDEPQLAIHLPLRQRATFAQLVDAEVIPQISARLLNAAVIARRGILVASAPTLPGEMVLASLAALSPSTERVVVLEHGVPLSFEHAHRVTVRLAGCDREQCRAICAAAALLRPDRVVLAGLEPASARWLLETAPGVAGALGLAPAADAGAAVQRLEAAAISDGLTRDAVAPLLAATFSLVLTLGRLPDGRITLWRIAELVAGAGGVRLRDLYLTTQADDDRSAVPVLVPTGLVPTFLPSLAPFGVAIEASYFARETHGLPAPGAAFDGAGELLTSTAPQRQRQRVPDPAAPAASAAPAAPPPLQPTRPTSLADDPGWELGLLPDPQLPEVDPSVLAAGLAAARPLRPARPAAEAAGENTFGQFLKTRRVAPVDRINGGQRYVPQPPPMHPQAHHLHLEPPPPTRPLAEETAEPEGAPPSTDTEKK